MSAANQAAENGSSGSGLVTRNACPPAPPLAHGRQAIRTLVTTMSAEYTSNHFVPQWYQRRFLPEGQADRELYLLDLKPEFFRDGRGVRRQRKALRRTGTRKCFAIDDLYTTRVAGVESRELERVFFGEIDRRGKDAVAFFDRFDHDRLSGSALTDLMMYMSTQKLRTPKGLDWLATQVRASDRNDVLDRMPELRSLYGAIWAESVWQIADASASPTNSSSPTTRSRSTTERAPQGIHSGPRARMSRTYVFREPTRSSRCPVKSS